MIPSIRAEARKLFTVRSTYVILLICAAILVFFAYYIEGFRQATDVTNTDKLSTDITAVAQALNLFVPFAGVLLMTHEYRYNTVLYTLTSASNRLKVLLAKIIVITIFSVGVIAIGSLLAPVLTQLGLQAHNLSMAHQDLHLGNLILRTAFYGWGYSMLALIIAALVRSQVAAIAILLLFPGIVETLLALLLRGKAIYLPFNALTRILQDKSTSVGTGGLGQDNLSLSGAAIVVVLYLIFGWTVAAILFLKRDAN